MPPSLIFHAGCLLIGDMKTAIAKHRKLLLIVAILLVAVIVVARFSGAPGPSDHSADYNEALSRYPAVYADDAVVENFARVYSDLKSPELASAIYGAYAEELYFNDTFNTFTTLAELKEYLLHTADNLRKSSVRIEDIARSGNDVYIRWHMAIEVNVKGRDIDSRSIGITHLRFNEQGRITVHQDYWDGVDAFYQHLPYVGHWIRKLREQL